MSFENTDNQKTIVLVTNQFQCERLIHAGKVLADMTDTELCVFSVQNSKYPQNPLALEHLYEVSKANQAVMNVSYGGEPLRQIVKFIKHNKARNILTGTPQNKHSLLYTVWRKFTHIRFFTVNEEGATSEITQADIPLSSPVTSEAL